MPRLGMWLGLTVAGLALAAAPARAAELGPLCAGLAQQMNLSESLVGGFVSSLPVAPTATFCPWLTQNLTQTQACDYLTLVHLGLTAGGPPKCNAEEFLSYQVLPTGNLTRLTDRRPLPAVFPDTAAMLKEEGATYNWLYRMIENAHAFVPCADQLGLEGLLLPPGWELRAVANLTQGDGTPALPMVFLLGNQVNNQLLFLVRATVTPAEWSTNFEINHTADPEVAAIFGEDAGVASGFASIFSEVWPEVQAALDEYVVGSEPGSTPEVWFTGHSMGASVAQLLAYASQQHLNEKMGADKAPVISAPFFALPQAGTAALMERSAKLLNSRDLSFLNDVVYELGILGVATNQNNATSWEYGAPPGQMVFGPSDMPQDAASWARLDTMPLCWATNYLWGAHTCSYSCLLSQYSPEPVEQDQCWLSAKPAGAPGSQCPSFPAPGYLGADAGVAAPSPAPAADGAPGSTPPATPVPSAASPQQASAMLLATLLAAALLVAA